MPKNNFSILSNLHMPINVDTQFLERFGENLKKLRKAKGISQAQLAFEANIELSQISRIELGKINTTIGSINQIAKTLEIPLEDLFKDLD